MKMKQKYEVRRRKDSIDKICAGLINKKARELKEEIRELKRKKKFITLTDAENKVYITTINHRVEQLNKELEQLG